MQLRRPQSKVVYDTIKSHNEDGSRADPPEETWIRWNIVFTFLLNCAITNHFKKDTRLKNPVVFFDTKKYKAQILDKDGEFYIIPRQFTSA